MDALPPNQGNGALENLTNFNNTGNFNITVVYEATQNYSASSRTHFVLVRDTTFPTAVQNSPVDYYNSSSNMVLFKDSGNLRKFDTVDDIIECFCNVRYEDLRLQ